MGQRCWGRGCHVSHHTELPRWVSPAQTRGQAPPQSDPGAAGWSVLSGPPSHRHEGEGKLLLALTLNRDLDRRRGFRGSCPPGLSGTGWGLFPRPALMVGVGGGWGGQPLNKPEKRAWPEMPGRARCPRGPGNTGRGSPVSSRSHPECGSQPLGSPGPSGGHSEWNHQNKLPRTKCPIITQAIRADHACLTATVYSSIGSFCSMNVQTISHRYFLLP